MNLIRSLYLNNLLFILAGLNITVFVLAFSFPWMMGAGKVFLLVLLLLVLTDIVMLFRNADAMSGKRFCADKLSNGDENEIRIVVSNHYPFKVKLEIQDETPAQFQLRDMAVSAVLTPGQSKTLRYYLRPVRRGEYKFGAVNVFATGLLGLVARRFKFSKDKMVAVYPSYLQMRKYELYAISNRLTELGVKKIRKIGQNMEFDQIREYVPGDDYRALNWKATARKNQLMVNQFRDERSQQVYSVIDKGRVMKMPFNGMTLLDYAINSSLVISNIAIQKSDKAGLITFSKKVATTVPASNRSGQMSMIQEALYNQKTGFKESDYETLFINIKRRISQRSLILLYTNFETLASLERQLGYLRNIARYHLLVVIFFENTELRELLALNPTDTEEIYIKTIGEKFVHEKRQIVKELNKHGIHSILTTPEQLTVNTLNKYLELKARNLI